MLSYSSYTDSELLHLLALDDEKAFTEIYNRYWKTLFAIASNKARNVEDAREIVQELFLDIWKRRHTLVISTTLKTYLSIALNYKVSDLLAKINQRLRYEEYASKKLSIADESTEQWLSFEELKERLNSMVAELPEKCRLVFRLSREGGMSQREIADALNISEKTVESHLARAIRELRTGIKHILFFLLS